MAPLSNRAALTALTLITFAFSATAAAAQSRVPALDLTATCRALDSTDFSMQIDTQRCLKSEHEARDKLSTEWTRYSAADRDLCTQTAKMGGVHSYVQLLTCLELQHDVAVDRARGESRPDANRNSVAADPALRNRPAKLRERKD